KTRHDEIQVNLGVLVFAIIQVEQFVVVKQSYTDRRDAPLQKFSGRSQQRRAGREGIEHRDVGAVDGSRPRATVGLQDVAIDVKRPLPQFFQVHNSAETA